MRPFPAAARIALRAMLAIFGGYALASACAMALPPLLPLPLPQAVLAATLLGFVVHAVAVLWCFAQPRLLTVAAGLLLPSAALALLSSVLLGGTS